jgi:hypothetical protein
VRRLAASRSAVLFGERVAELVGRDALATLPAALRMVVFDCHALDVPATDACIGIPNWVERTGTYVNVDGVRGPISAVKAPPRGVRTLVEHLDELARTALGPAADAAIVGAAAVGGSGGEPPAVTRR